MAALSDLKGGETLVGSTSELHVPAISANNFYNEEGRFS